jgi:hypothetical protein
MPEKIEIKKPVLDNQVFQAAERLDIWDSIHIVGTVVAKHHVGPHPAGEVVFDSAEYDAENLTITYQGPRTRLPVTVETGRIDANENEETFEQEAPYVDGCNEDTSYTYQLILSVGAQIATE